MTIYTYDTEFLEDGKTIDLISIGIVCEDGREYYSVNVDCDFESICRHDWLWDNVVPHLPTNKADWDDPAFGRGVTWLDKRSALVKPKWVIANEVRDFLLSGDEPELWAYYGAYDHVALAQLFGPMIVFPPGLPMWTHELMQLFEESWITEMPDHDEGEHDALADARWNMKLYNTIKKDGDHQ